MPRVLTSRPASLLALGLLLSLLAGACGAPGNSGQPRAVLATGDPEHGRQAMLDYGCGTCHTIPGVPGARSLVGPPLDQWAERNYIAGLLPNTLENLVLFIRFPQSVAPGIVMPDMGVSEAEAHDIAAYLYNLRQERWWELPGW